jgi:hypothetical protein
VAEKDPAITALEAQLAQLNRTLGDVERGARKARDGMENTGKGADGAAPKVKTLADRAREAAREIAGIEPASDHAGSAVNTLASVFNEAARGGMSAGVSAVTQWIEAMPEAAARSDRHAAALAALGGAYDEVRRATAGSVSAEQAAQVSQRAAQAGLRLSAQELAAVTQRAREYARATGTEVGQALEQLTDQLINPGEELSRFGVRLQTGMAAGDAMREALRQLTVQAGASGVAAQSLSEAHEDLNRALSEANDRLSAVVAEEIGLRDFFGQLASWIRDAASATSAWDASLDAVVGTLREAVGLRSEVDAGRQQNQSASGAFVEQYGPLVAQARAAGIDTRRLPMPGEIAQASGAEQARIIAALTRDINARRAAGTSRTTAGAEALFGGGFDARTAGLPSFGIEGATGMSSAADVAGEVANAVASRAAAAAEASRRAAAAAEAARRAEIARRNRASTSTTAAGFDDAANARALDEQFANARGAPVSQEWAASFVASLQRQLAQVTATQGGTIAGRAEGIDLQTRSREAQLGVGRGGQGDFDPTTRAGQDQSRRERVTVLREQREALAALLVEAEREEQLARAAGASTDEVNSLMRQRIEIQRALAHSTTELTQATAQNTSALSEMGDKLATVAEGMALGFAEAAVAALDGAKSFDQAIGEMLRSTLKSVAQMAIVEVLKNTALGIGHLASFNYPGAGQAFAAAGAWAAVGAVAGMAIVATRPSTASAGAAPSSTGSGVGARPDTAARPDRRDSGPLVLNVTVSGAIFETRHEVLQGIARGMTEARVHGYLPRLD